MLVVLTYDSTASSPSHDESGSEKEGGDDPNDDRYADTCTEATSTANSSVLCKENGEHPQALHIKGACWVAVSRHIEQHHVASEFPISTHQHWQGRDQGRRQQQRKTPEGKQPAMQAQHS